jgi:hypothetical protein
MKGSPIRQPVFIHFVTVFLSQKLEFRSGLLEWAETARIYFSGMRLALV